MSSGWVLPHGFRLRLRDDTRVFASSTPGGLVLLGGSPTRSMSLSRRASETIDGREITVTDAVSAIVGRRLLDANLADPGPRPPVDASTITVVVPVRDRATQLDRCLAGLAGIRVLVVDDASADPAAVQEVATRHGADMLALTSNVGPAGARNAGLARVATPLVAFVDSDVTTSVDTLRALAAHLDDPDLALVAPLVRGVTRTARPRWYERHDAAASSLALGERGCSVALGAAVAWVPSACLVARVAALRTLSPTTGFDANMRVGEDVDLVWRLLGSGWRVRYEPSLEAQHDTRSSLADILGRKFLYGTGSASLAVRHGRAVAVARLSPLMAVGGIGVLLCRPWSVLLATVAVVWAAREVRAALPPFRGRGVTAVGLGIRGVGWAVRQESALLLRHWWPATVAAVAVSPAVRRLAVGALIVDTAVAATVDRPLRRPDLPACAWWEVILGRRLDDLAYGAGLWWGALRQNSASALAVAFTGGRDGVR